MTNMTTDMFEKRSASARTVHRMPLTATRVEHFHDKDAAAKRQAYDRSSTSQASMDGAASDVAASVASITPFPFPAKTPGQPLGLAGKSLRFKVAKRAMDIAGATAGLVLLAPLLLGSAAVIKLTSPGPVFFRQKRYGLNGELFSIYKFRTMYANKGDATGVQQTTGNDPRITPVGRFLRRTSFDELPQLLNVLDGSMSLVGPRPHVPNMLAAGVRYEDFDPRYMDRHSMVPGITGLAQVNGFRGETTTYEAAKGRIDKDIQYARTATVGGDIAIVLKTLRCEFLSGSGS